MSYKTCAGPVLGIDVCVLFTIWISLNSISVPREINSSEYKKEPCLNHKCTNAERVGAKIIVSFLTVTHYTIIIDVLSTL